jgi:hypothetical protein
MILLCTLFPCVVHSAGLEQARDVHVKTVRFHEEARDAPIPPMSHPASDLVYSTFLGGSGDALHYWGDGAGAIAVDSAGCVYIAGTASSSDFPATAGAFQTSRNGEYLNAFVAKLSSDGSSLVYSTYLGGSVEDWASSIAVDSAGCVYLAGGASSSNFPTTRGAFQTTLHQGSENAFVTKLRASGASLVYSTFLGGTVEDYASSLAIDPSGFAYVTGFTASPDFPTTPGTFQTSFNCAYGQAFVTKLDTTGSSLVYSTYLGGSGSYGDGANGIAVDSAGCAYVTGYTYSTDFPTTSSAFQATLNSASDYSNAFVTKLSSTGESLVYSTFLGGSVEASASAIAVDSAGCAYVVGETSSSDFPTTPGAFEPSLKQGGENAFVTKLNATGSSMVYSTFLGGSEDFYGDGANAIAVDSSGCAYVVGYTYSANFPTTPGAFRTALKNAMYGSNAFVTKLNSTGSSLVYSTYLGGSGYADPSGRHYSDQASAIAIDRFGCAYVAGSTASSDFPTSPGAFQTSFNCVYGQAFVTKLSMGMHTGLAGLAFDGSIWYTTDLSTWTNVPGKLTSLVIGDFSGNGNRGMAGIAADDSIWFTTDLSNWTRIPGSLSIIAVGDVNGGGKDDIVGLYSDGSIWYTTDERTWHNIPGNLSSLVPGRFTGGNIYGIAGRASDGSIWCTTDLVAWHNVPGNLSNLVVGSFSRDGVDELAGVTQTDSVWYTKDMQNWTNVPGILDSIVVGDFSGDGIAGIAGLSPDGSVLYTTDLQNWTNVPGNLKSLVTEDLFGDGKDCLIGLALDGSIWYTEDMQSWRNIPGQLSSLVAFRE